MPSSEKKKLKDLHLASSLGDLNKLADPGLPVDRNANPATYIKSADKVYLKAQSHDLEGDEENAYVFYMRFFNIISLIKKSSKYTEKKKYYDDLMGKSKTLRSIDRAEALQKSLDKRYEKLKAQKEANAKAEEEAKRKEEEDKKALMSKKAQNNGVDSDDNDLDSLLNGVGISSSADVYQKLKVSHGSILTPKTSDNTDGTLISGLESPSFSTKPHGKPCVSAQDLYDLLMGENESKVLVLDCRPNSMFLQNRINRPSCINIPAELLDQGVSAGSIERRLREDTRRIWKKRGEKEFVILMDESTKVADITPDCRIQRLKDVIFTFDLYSSLKTEPLFLDGGFQSWLWHYPSLALKPELPKMPGNTQVTHPVKPEPQQPLSKKPSSYVTGPGLPPGWERIENGGRPYYKDHNTQTTHWEAPKVPTTGTKVAAPQSSGPKQQQLQIKRQSSVDRPSFKSIIPNQLGPGKPVAPLNTTVHHPSNQSISQAGVPGSGSQTVPTARPSSIPSTAVPKPFSTTNVPLPVPSSMPSAHTCIPSTQPPTSQSTPSAHMTSSGSDGSRQMLSNSGPTISPVPQIQPVSINSTSSGASQASSVAPAPVTPSTVSPSSATSNSQGPRVATPSVPGQMPQQVSHTAQPGHQTQVSSVSQVPHGDRQAPGQSSHSAISPHQAASKSIPSADPRNNQHGRQAPTNTTQVPPYSNVAGTTQHSPQKPTQVPGNTQVTPPVKPEPQQPLPKKPSSYVTGPGLPPDWERIETQADEFYVNDKVRVMKDPELVKKKKRAWRVGRRDDCGARRFPIELDQQEQKGVKEEQTSQKELTGLQLQQELERERLHEQLGEKYMSMIRMGQQPRMKDRQQQNLQRQSREMEQQLTNCHGQLRQKNEQLRGKDEELREKDEELNEINDQAREKDEQLGEKDEQLREKDGQLREKDDQLREKDEQLGEKDEQLRKKDEELSEINEQLRQKDEQLGEKDEQLREKDEELREKDEELREINEQLTQKDEQLGEKDEQLREKVEQLSEINEQLRQKDEQLREKDEEQEHLQGQLGEMEQQLREKEQQDENLQRQLMEMGWQLTNFEEQLREREEERVNLQQQNVNLERQLEDKDEEVNELEISLSTTQQTISEQRRQETCDWVIARDEIQISDKCLGSGGWGSVYEGMYCGSSVAVKQIHELILSPHNIRLFEREMNIASRCRHPCLLQFIGASSDEGSPLFVTELMETSLRELLQQQQLSIKEVAVISLDVAKAINYLHEKKPEPIIHRDISSANVLLWRQGDQWRGKVSDYGTANFIKHTMTVAPGAFIYSAPEALTSNQTEKVDVYSFGVLMCEMCVRELPDPGKREEQVALVTNRAFRGLVRRSLQTDPQLRPRMLEIIDSLRQFNV